MSNMIKTTTWTTSVVRATRLTAFVLMLILATVACSPDEGSQEEPAGSEKSATPDGGTAAGTLRWAVPTAIETLDPQASFSLTTGMAVGRNIFDRLVEVDEDLEVVPGLATDWELSDDGLSWTFRLREDVEFHDGTPFTAESVKFSIDRALDPDNGLVAGNFAFGGVTEVEVVDDTTVVLHTEEPIAALLTNIADGGLGSIISPSSINGDGEFGDPIGTGALRFVSWQPDVDMVLERNDDYWGEGPGYEQLEVITSTEGSTRVNELEAGEVDLISLVPIQDIQRVEAVEGVEMAAEPATTMVYVAMNNARPPFDQQEVRQAFNYAVDKQPIIENILGGLGRVPDSPLASGFSMHTSVMSYDYSPERAIELLEDAGWNEGSDGVREKDGQRLEATLRYGEGNIEQDEVIVQTIASQLEDIGAEIQIEAMEFSTFSEQNRMPLDESSVEMALARFGTGDPDTYLGSTLHTDAQPPAGNNFAFYSNAEVDAALDEGGSLFDNEQRRPYYEQAQQLIMEEAPWIFLTERREAVAWHDYVSGIRFIPTSAGLIDVRQVTLDE